MVQFKVSGFWFRLWPFINLGDRKMITDNYVVYISFYHFSREVPDPTIRLAYKYLYLIPTIREFRSTPVWCTIPESKK